MTDGADRVAVPGGEVRFDGHGLVASARLPAPRDVVRVTVEGAGALDWRLEDRGRDGAARVVCDALAAGVRADAVVVLAAKRSVELVVEPLFRPEYAEAARGRRLLLDEDGGVGVFPVRPGGRRGGPPYPYGLRPGDELWLSVHPSRPPSPLRASEHVAHEGRLRPFPDGAYPSTGIIEDAARHCRVLALHAYFWDAGPRRVDLRAGRYAFRRRPWTAARHVPADPERFARVREDARRNAMKLVVYLSPRHTGAPDLVEEMRRVLDEYAVDGLYLDGLSDDFRANDAFVRRTREILGPDRILYLNATDEPFGTPRVHTPFVDAAADYVLRGDSGRGGLPLARFLRYAVGGRNVSNAVGMWCHYGSSGRVLPVERPPSARDVDAALAAGARLWRRSVWGAALADFDRRYYPRLP